MASLDLVGGRPSGSLEARLTSREGGTWWEQMEKAEREAQFCLKRSTAGAQAWESVGRQKFALVASSEIGLGQLGSTLARLASLLLDIEFLYLGLYTISHSCDRIDTVQPGEEINEDLSETVSVTTTRLA